MEREQSMMPVAEGGRGQRGRPWRRFRVAGMIMAVTVLAGSGLASGAEGGSGPVRVRGQAMGLGAHFVWSRPGTAPMEPIFDVSFGTAGGSHDQLINQNAGFAASFYPGATPSTPGSVLGLAGFPIGGQIFPPEHPLYQGYRSIPGLIPPWPMATYGSYPGDPGRRVDLLADVTGTIPAPLPTDIQGMTQETVVDKDVVTAVTNIERLSVTSLGGLNPETEPLVAQLDAATKAYTGGDRGVRGNSFTLKGLNSRYESVNTGTTARSTAEVTVREVDVLGGLLEFFRVRSLVEYTGDAAGAKLTNQIAEVGMARALGLEVTFDDRGMKLTDKRIPANQGSAVTALLSQILERAGFTVQTTTARVQGNKVDEVALRIVMAEQEPQLPGATFLGRKTTVTFEVGALGSDFQTVPGRDDEGGMPGAGPGGGDDGAALGVSLPAPGIGLSSNGGTGNDSPGTATSTAGPVLRRTTGAAGRSGGGVGGAVTAPPPAEAAPAAAGGEQTALGEAVAAPTLPPGARAGVTRPVARGAKEDPSQTLLLLLPGVAATAAEQREIASGVAAIGRRMSALAGAGALAGLIVWRRRRGALR